MKKIIAFALEMDKLIEVKYEKKPSRLTKNLIEMGKDLKDLGLLDEETYEKIIFDLVSAQLDEKVKTDFLFRTTQNKHGLQNTSI